MSRLCVSGAALAMVVTSVVAGCAAKVEAPFDTGVCYNVVLPPEGSKDKPRFNVVATNQPQIEFCAARLEEMRLRFLRLGGNNRELLGAYQGQFIFLERRGVSFSRSLTGTRFFALARTGEGRLAIPGAIQRNIDDAGPPAPVAAPPP